MSNDIPIIQILHESTYPREYEPGIIQDPVVLQQSTTTTPDNVTKSHTQRKCSITTKEPPLSPEALCDRLINKTRLQASIMIDKLNLEILDLKSINKNNTNKIIELSESLEKKSTTCPPCIQNKCYCSKPELDWRTFQYEQSQRQLGNLQSAYNNCIADRNNKINELSRKTSDLTSLQQRFNRFCNMFPLKCLAFS